MSDNKETVDEEYDAISTLLKSQSEIKSGCITFKEIIDSLPKLERTFNKSKQRLSNNLTNMIVVLDECITKGQELLRSLL